jgi:hypothetical protein
MSRAEVGAAASARTCLLNRVTTYLAHPARGTSWSDGAGFIVSAPLAARSRPGNRSRRILRLKGSLPQRRARLERAIDRDPRLGQQVSNRSRTMTGYVRLSGQSRTLARRTAPNWLVQISSSRVSVRVMLSTPDIAVVDICALVFGHPRAAEDLGHDGRVRAQRGQGSPATPRISIIHATPNGPAWPSRDIYDSPGQEPAGLIAANAGT